MSLTNLQIGAWNVLGLSLGQDPLFTGNVFFVSSGIGSNTQPGTKEEPFATIDYAIGCCVADHGDVIYALPGHAETLAAASAITCDISGISIIGVGSGTVRPALTWSVDTATIVVSAANVRWRNFQFKNAIDGLVTGIAIGAAGCQIIGSEFSSPTSTDDALIWVATDANGDDLLVFGNDFRQSHAGPTECIRLVGADRAKIIGNYIIGSFSTSAINGITTASLEILIAHNTICNSVTDKLLIDLVANCTGRIEYNSGQVVSTGAWTAANICDAASCQLAENYVSDANGETGKLLGTVSA